jgi:serine/threonine-protein kinase HipA
MTRKLNVYLHHDYVGELIQDPSGQMLFTYSKDWLNHPNKTPLSHSLPLVQHTFKRNECRGFFSGVLPGENIRNIIAPLLGISARNDFAMLEIIGGECAGAVTFLPAGSSPDQSSNEYRPLSNFELADILKTLPQRPLLAGQKHVRLSLAGAQDKIALLERNNKYSIPLKNSPSSHILKPANEHFENIIENEAFCLSLANKLSIPSVRACADEVEGIPFLKIERYDRLIDSNGNIQRVHQEDFCQALGIASEIKYQNEGGPSLKQCFDLVRAVSDVPALDLKYLLDMAIFNYCVGNDDAHGKNFSILSLGNHIRLAPFYDVVCTAYYPNLSKKMAMKIGSKYVSSDVRPRHFEQLANEIGFAAPIVKKLVPETAHKMAEIISREYKMNKLSKFIYNRCMTINKLFKKS